MGPEGSADSSTVRCIMLSKAFWRCAVVGARAYLPSCPSSVGFSPLALSRVRCAATVSGKGTKSVELADFLAEIGVPDKDVVRIAGSSNLQKYRVSTLRTNYTGLVATLGAEGALGGILKSYGLLTSPPDTTSSAYAAWMDILGADRAAAA